MQPFHSASVTDLCHNGSPECAADRAVENLMGTDQYDVRLRMYRVCPCKVDIVENRVDDARSSRASCT
jgi:hypothetical protein